MFNQYMNLVLSILGAMAIIYVIFNFLDFIKSWGSWIMLLAKGIWKFIVNAYRWIISLFKRK